MVTAKFCNAMMADVIGASPAMVALRQQAGCLLGQPTSGRRPPAVLIQGESGVGKGLLARAIHQASARRQAAWVDVNCAAIPENLVEVELFGAERGAFTDARERRPGLFQAADGGVLFLDEVGTLPLPAQAKLLAAVEQRQVRRVGSSRPEPVDVWIISATNDDLERAVEEKRFRRDLYYRLAAAPLRIPPLRERGGDAVRLAEHFLSDACAAWARPAKRLTADAQRALCDHAWPGNVRELANLMERVALLTDATEIGPELLGLPRAAGRGHETRGGRRVVHPDAEREVLLAALESEGWSLFRAAARLGMARSTLRYRVERLGLRREEASRRAEPGASAGSVASREGSTAGTRSGPAALRWERRWVTALHAVLTPRDGAAPFHLAAVLDDLVEKLPGFGGHLEGVHPRGFLALFGLEPVEDAASRAVHAAWATRRAVEQLQRGVDVSCALQSRECLIGRGASIAGLDPGDKQRLLASLESLAGEAALPGVLVGADTARFLERRFELSPADDGGRGAPRAHWVVDRARRGFGVGGGAGSPLLGRDRERAALNGLLAEAEQGRGQVVGLSGEPGVGKSRLLYDFWRGLEPGRITYVEGRCVSYGHGIPYLPVLDLVRQHLALDDADAPEVVAEKIERRLRGLDLDAAALTPYFLHLLGFKERMEGPLGGLAPETIGVRTIDALRLLTVARQRERVTVIAIEDMQWVDRASEEALAALVESAAGCRLLLVCTYRPGYHPPWLAKSYATQLVLGRLSPLDSAAIVRHGPARGALGLDLVEAIVARADGNPFFLEELARAASDHPEAGPDIAVPETIRGVLAARIDGLPPDGKRVLDAAAALGREFEAPVLRQLAGLTDPAFSRALAHLQANEFLVETRAAPASTYAFRHSLTREVASRTVAVRLRPCVPDGQ